ncbi:MAG: tetratricopeptide repeat protein [Methylococcaceae bacterium]
MSSVLLVLFWTLALIFSANAGARMPTTNQRLEQLQQQLGEMNAELAVVKNDHERLIALTKSIAELEAAKNDTADHDRLLVQSKGLADLEKRLEDSAQSTSDWRAFSGNLITLFGVLFTALVIYFSWRAVNEARVTARLSARDEVKDWTDNNGEAEVKKWISKHGAVLQQVLKRMVRQGEKSQLQGEKILADIIQQGNKTLEEIAAQSAVTTDPPSSPHLGHEQDQDTSTREPRTNVVDTKTSLDEVVASAAKTESAIIEVPGIKTDADEITAADHPASGQDLDSDIAAQQAKALTGKGDELSSQGRWIEAIAAYDEAISRYRDYSETPVAEELARAMLKKGYVLSRQSQWSTALALYDQVAQAYGHRPEASIKALAVRGLLSKGYVLNQQGRNEEAITAYGEAWEVYGGCPEAVVAVQVAKALVSKGFALGKQGKLQAALATYDAVVSSYGDYREAGIAEQVAKALFNKGSILSQQRQWIAALTVYDELKHRYGGYSESGVVELVDRANSNHSFALSQLL